MTLGAVAILLAANMFIGRFFDEKSYQNVLFLQYSIFSVQIALLAYFISLTVGVVAGKRSLASGGRLAILQ